MILHGNQRGGARDLALHLLKDENELVDVHELRGFVSDNLMSALNEAYAVSRVTKAKQFLYSLSLNPPPKENVSTQDFVGAIERVEEELGLTGQPRAIVFHEKRGRRHAHAVWSRTDLEQMKAIPLSYTKRKLADISRELYVKHDWQMPRGFVNSKERDWLNFSMAQWQQAKLVGKDPRAIKIALQECWAVSDTQATFEQALKERGYTLARGDRRGFVALDHKCEPFSISKKWIGKSAKEVRSRLSDPDILPSVDRAKAQIVSDIQSRLNELAQEGQTAVSSRISDLGQTLSTMTQKHRRERQTLASTQQSRWETETKTRQQRFSKGLRGLIDHFTGKRRRIREQNEQETLLASQRDQAEKDRLIFSQLEQRRVLQARIERLQSFADQRAQVLSRDMQRYEDVRQNERDTVIFEHTPKHRDRGPEPER